MLCCVFVMCVCVCCVFVMCVCAVLYRVRYTSIDTGLYNPSVEMRVQAREACVKTHNVLKHNNHHYPSCY